GKCGIACVMSCHPFHHHASFLTMIKLVKYGEAVTVIVKQAPVTIRLLPRLLKGLEALDHFFCVTCGRVQGGECMVSAIKVTRKPAINFVTTFRIINIE